MAKLSVTEAAFHGFGIVKRDPLTYLGVALVLAVLAILLAATMIPAYGRLLEVIQSGGGDQAAMEAMVGFYAAVGPVYLLMIPFYMIVLGALARSLVFGQSQGWALGLKLGMDEVRAIVVCFVVGILAFLPYLGAVIVGGIIMGVLYGTLGDGGAAAGVLVIAVAYIAGLVLMIWIGLRLSFAVPASVGEKRFVIFGSWGMTKGRFWSLFLAYLLLFVIICLVYLVVFGVVLAVFGGSLAAMANGNGDYSALTELSVGPAVIVGSLVYGLIGSIIGAAYLGVPARGYLDWKASAGAGAGSGPV